VLIALCISPQIPGNEMARQVIIWCNNLVIILSILYWEYNRFNAIACYHSVSGGFIITL
jgi:hypothetical protein